MKKEKVWEMIASRMHEKSPNQARNKFKYLKRRYFRKEEDSAKFTYWRKMDDIFGGSSECAQTNNESPEVSRDENGMAQKCRAIPLAEVVAKRETAKQRHRMERRKRREDRIARVKVAKEVLVRLERCAQKLQKLCDQR